MVSGRSLASSAFKSSSKLNTGYISRLSSQTSIQQLPFILQNRQTFEEGKTYVISSLEDLAELPKLLSQVNAFNAHLKPTSLILSEMIRDPVGD